MTRLFGPSLWAVPASRNPKYRPGSGHEKTTRMSYLFERDSLRTTPQLDPQAPTRRGGVGGGVGLASGFEGLLEAQDADQGGGYRLRTGRERDADSRAAVALVEVRARSKCHPVFLQQGLAPGLRVRMWTELVSNAGVDVEGAVGRGNPAPTKIIDGIQHNRPGIGKGCHPGIGLSVGLVGESGDRRVLSRHRWTQGEVSGQCVEGTQQVGRHQAPAKPPPGHSPVLEERGDHDRLAIMLPGAAGCDGVVSDAVVDLIADQPDSMITTPGSKLGKLIWDDHGAGGIGRGGDHESR